MAACRALARLTLPRTMRRLAVASLKKHLGEANIRRIIDWTLRYLSEVDIPKKRGTFVEFRNGLINISPVGRNCDQEERDEFEAYDKVALPSPLYLALSHVKILFHQ